MKFGEPDNDKVVELISRITKAAGEVGTDPGETMHAILCVYVGITCTLGINKEKARELLNLWINECPERFFDKDVPITNTKLSN